MVKHFFAEGCYDTDGRSKEADSPEKSAEGHENDDENDGDTDLIEEKIHIEGMDFFSYEDGAIVHTIKKHAIQLGDFELEIVYQDEGKNADQQNAAVSNIVAVDVFSENHKTSDRG